jgi:type IV secretory pathway VirB10-like protein
MNIGALRHDMAAMQEANLRAMEQMAHQIHELSQRRVEPERVTAPVDVPPLMRPARLNERFTGEYQAKVNHFKSNRNTGWAMNDNEIRSLVERLTALPVSAVQAMELSVMGAMDAPVMVMQNEYVIPSGSRIIAVTEQPVHSDHPGLFTSRIVRPEILRGAQLICQNSGQMNGRIPVQVVRVIFRDAEYSLSGQIEMGFPGLTGRVNRHYFGRSVPLLANAAITGGFVAWSANNRGNDRIDTRDAITAEVINQSLPQIQNEISRFGTDRGPTVEVAAGTQFSILLTSPLTVRF